MQTGDTVKVIYSGQVGQVEVVKDDRALVKFPIMLRNGQAGTLHKEYTVRNLEVIENGKSQ